MKGHSALRVCESGESYQVLEDEREALISVDDVVQSHDVGVLEVLQ